MFFVPEFVLENGLILEQRLIFGHREKRRFSLKNVRFSKNCAIFVAYRETMRFS